MMPGLGICLLCISLAAPVSPPGKSPELVERERQLDSIYNPPVSETGADMHFATRVVDAGTIKENAVPPEYTYTWTNGGDRPVTVLKVTTTCGCAVPSFDRAPVLPGEEGSLKVTYHPKGPPGNFDRRIFVYTDLSGSKPAAVLSLKGFVEAAGVPVWAFGHRMGHLCLKRAEVQIDGARKAVERIMCVNAGDSPLTIGVDKALLPPYLSFRCEPETIPPGGEADLVITYDPGAAPMRMLNVVPMVLTGLDLPPSQRTITVKFKVETNIDR